MTRYYNIWAGNPKGRAEDTERCIAEVWQDMHSYQCSRKRTLDDPLCKQHRNMEKRGQSIFVPKRSGPP